MKVELLPCLLFRPTSALSSAENIIRISDTSVFFSVYSSGAANACDNGLPVMKRNN